MAVAEAVYRTPWLAWSLFAMHLGLMGTITGPLIYLGVRDSSLALIVLGSLSTLFLGYLAVASARLRVTANGEGVTRRGLRERTWFWHVVEDVDFHRDPRLGVLLLGVVTSKRLGGRHSLGLAALPTATSQARLEQVASELRVLQRAGKRTARSG